MLDWRMNQPALPFTPTGTTSLLDAVADFKAVYMAARNYSSRTREEYISDIEDLARFLDDKSIGTWSVVGFHDLQGYLAQLDHRGLSPASRNRKSYTIKTFFGFLAQSGYTRKDVSELLIPPSIPHKERRFLDEDEYQRLLAGASLVRDKAILEVFLQTGLRLSELVGLNVGDLELPKRITHDPQNVGFLHVRRKRGKEALLPLNWKVCEALSSWIRERKAKDTTSLESRALFTSKFGKKMSPRALRYLVVKYLERAGISGASVHTLRHTMATHYLAKGGDLKSVQELLGHESLETTQIYLGLAKKVQRRMVQEFAL